MQLARGNNAAQKRLLAKQGGVEHQEWCSSGAASGAVTGPDAAPAERPGRSRLTGATSSTSYHKAKRSSSGREDTGCTRPTWRRSIASRSWANNQRNRIAKRGASEASHRFPKRLCELSGFVLKQLKLGIEYASIGLIVVSLYTLHLRR